MRVKFGKRIYLCTIATCSGDCMLLTTNNGFYTVVFESDEAAQHCHTFLLENGYYDFSNCNYSN